MNAKRMILVLSSVIATAACGGAAGSAAAPSAMPVSATENASAAVSPMSAASEADEVSSVSPTESARSPVIATPVAKPSTVMAATTAPTAKSDTTKKVDAPAADVLVMYTGDVSMAVEDGKVSATIDRIVDVAESFGGHLAGRRDLGVTVRIPSARFREALAKVGELGDITHEAVTAEDVSEEFHDAEVRLANLKSTQKRLQEFLAKSGSMSDMLTIEHELERVSMDIDRIEGRMRFLREHVAYSTLTIALMARAKTGAAIAAGGSGKEPPRVMQLHASWLQTIGVNPLVAN